MKKKLRVGMIGYGFMGKAHTNAFRQAAKFFPDLPYEPELKMFCARNEERAKSFASNWGYEKVVTDWREVVESKEIDVIDIVHKLCGPLGDFYEGTPVELDPNVIKLYIEKIKLIEITNLKLLSATGEEINLI